MTDNIISSRIEFKDFSSDEPAKENAYLSALDLPIDDKAVFLVAGQDSRLGAFTVVAKALKAKGIKLYAAPSVCEKLGTGIPVKGKSDEYYRAVATSRFVYVMEYLPAFFAPRDGQFVINAIHKKPANLDEIIANNCTEIKTSYHFSAGSGLGKIAYAKLLSIFNHPQKLDEYKEEKPANGKKKILIAANIQKDPNAFEMFKRVALSHRNDAQVTLLIDSKSVREYEDELQKMVGSIRILPKQGLLPRKVEDNDKVMFLGKEFQFLENPDDVYDFLPDYIFANEQKRLLGNERFDKAYNLMNNSFYWTLLLKRVSDSYIYVNTLANTILSDPDRIARNHTLSHYEKVYFLREDMYSAAIQDCEDVDSAADTFGVFPYFAGEDDKSKVKTVFLNGEKRLLISSKNRGIFGTKVISTIPYFEDKQADYAVVNYNLSAEQNVDIINSMPTDRMLFVIDPYGTLLGNTMFVSGGKLVRIESLKDFSVLLKYFGKCNVIGDNPDVEAEAKRAGKEIVHY